MNAITRFTAGVPTDPLVDAASGQVTPAWRAFLTQLWIRTGGSIGQSTDTSGLAADLAAETAARIAGDEALNIAVGNEAAARIAGDDALQAALSLEAQVRAQADYNETIGRMNADALLVPRAQLCTLWAACDLSFLPTADPGGGKPWLSGNQVSVGTPSGAIIYIGMESGGGDWVLESGAAAWVWG